MQDLQNQLGILQTQLQQLHQALQKVQPIQPSGDLKQRIDTIVKQYFEPLKKNNWKMAGDIPISVFENYQSLVQQYAEVPTITKKEADNYNYLGARAALEYFDQKFLEPFLKESAEITNSPWQLEAQLESLGRTLATYLEVGEEVAALEDILDLYSNMTDIYKESAANAGENADETAGRLARFDTNLTKLAQLIMKNIISDFGQKEPYPYKQAVANVLPQNIANLYDKSLNLYRKTATMAERQYFDLYEQWRNHIRNWVDKPAVIGGDLLSPKEQQLKIMRLELEKSYQQAKQGLFSESQKKQLLKEIENYHDFMEKYGYQTEAHLLRDYFELCDQTQCQPNPKIPRPVTPVQPEKRPEDMTLSELMQAITDARAQWDANISTWTPEQREAARIRAKALIEGLPSKMGGGVSSTIATFYKQVKEPTQ